MSKKQEEQKSFHISIYEIKKKINIRLFKFITIPFCFKNHRYKQIVAGEGRGSVSPSDNWSMDEPMSPNQSKRTRGREAKQNFRVGNHHSSCIVLIFWPFVLFFKNISCLISRVLTAEPNYCIRPLSWEPFHCCRINLKFQLKNKMSNSLCLLIILLKTYTITC